MYSLGNIQIAQAPTLTQEGKKAEAELNFVEAMKSQAQVLKLWKIILGERHHKTGDAPHKVGWHLHHKNEYNLALSVSYHQLLQENTKLLCREYIDQALDIYTGQPRIFKNGKFLATLRI